MLTMAPSRRRQQERHTWEHKDKHNKTCAKCGIRAQLRPDPHSRRWFTEWHLPDGTYVNNYAGGRTPPCEPAAKEDQAMTATDLEGDINVVPPLNPHEITYLREFAATRHMRRRGGPYVTDESGNASAGDVLDPHRPPDGQPELWCQWVPSDDGTAIEWDGCEKFRAPAEWMTYLIDTFLRPGAAVQKELQGNRVPGRFYPPEFAHFTFDHVLDGAIDVQGDGMDDRWRLVVTASTVTEQQARIAWGKED